MIKVHISVLRRRLQRSIDHGGESLKAEYPCVCKKGVLVQFATMQDDEKIAAGYSCGRCRRYMGLIQEKNGDNCKSVKNP